MTARPLAMLCAALMLGSLFLPWISISGAGDVVPWDSFKALDRTQLTEMLQNLPPEGMAFVGSLALAAILVLLGLMGSSPRFIVFLAGALSVGLVAWGIYSAINQGNALGVPLDTSDLVQAAEELSKVLGIGAWAWIGGGAVLFLMGLFGSSRR